MRKSDYRISIRFHADRVLVHLEGAAEGECERHLAEVRAAAAQCGLEVVVLPRRPHERTRTAPRPPKRIR